MESWWLYRRQDEEEWAVVRCDLWIPVCEVYCVVPTQKVSIGPKTWSNPLDLIHQGRLIRLSL